MQKYTETQIFTLNTLECWPVGGGKWKWRWRQKRTNFKNKSNKRIDLRLKERMPDRVFRLGPHLDVCLTRRVLGSRALWPTV